MLSVVKSGRNWNKTKIICIPLLSATLKRIQEKIHIGFFEACFLILYFHACVCIYVTYMNKLVFKPKRI